MRRAIAFAALVWLAWPCQARTVDDVQDVPPEWAAGLEERILTAAIRDLQADGIRVFTETVPLERTGMTGHEAAQCRAIRFHEDGVGQHFTELLLCRWRPMSVTVPPPGSIQLVAPLWTVAESAVVFGPWIGPDGVAPEPKLLKRVEAVVAAAIDLDTLQAPCIAGSTTASPEGVQLIASDCATHYLSLQVALPGSRVPTDDELRAMAPGKMVELWLVPDIGDVTHRWIAPLPASAELVSLDAAGGHGLFGDYAPKTTPDTLLDYRGALAPRVAELPPASLEALPELILLLQRQRRQADAEPGEWIDGNVLLGAEERQYVPSDDELLEGEIGARVAGVLAAHEAKAIRKALRQAKVKHERVTYRSFGFWHVDVMGSGRFFYASPPEEKTLELP